MVQLHVCHILLMPSGQISKNRVFKTQNISSQLSILCMCMRETLAINSFKIKLIYIRMIIQQSKDI